MESDAFPPSSSPLAAASDLPNSPLFDDLQYTTPSLKSSSPRPIFSSDDSRESADIANYESPRIFKNKRKGNWWNIGNSAHSTPENKKAKITRNYDSGVYMLSDDSESSDSLPLQHKSPFGSNGHFDAASQTEPEPSTTSLKADMEAEEQQFYTILHFGLDQNADTYDFSGCNLEDRHMQQIGKLASVIGSVPDPGNELPAEGQYRCMVPELHVNLRHNQLRNLTPSLFSVENIRTLALDNNQIEELPGEFGQLRNLAELYVSNTDLAYLPYELLPLLGPDHRLHALGDVGVAWLEPKIRQEMSPAVLLASQIHLLAALREEDSSVRATAAHETMQKVYQIVEAQPDREKFIWAVRHFELWTQAIKAGQAQRVFPHQPSTSYNEDNGGLVYLARTPVSYFNEANVLLDGSPEPALTLDRKFEVITETDRGAHGVMLEALAAEAPKYMFPLATMALHSALRHRESVGLSFQGLRELIESLDEDEDEDHDARIGAPLLREAEAVLTQAELNDCAGFGAFRRCHVCKREYVIARAEWMEWWIGRIRAALPFRVKVCSWACVPEGMRTTPEEDLDWC
jgi:hypothetical protein